MAETPADPIIEPPDDEKPPDAGIEPAMISTEAGEEKKVNNTFPPPPAVKEPVRAAQLSAETIKPKRKRVIDRIFDPATRFGRGMRAFTRALGATVGLFSLGMLVTYVLFFQPLEAGYTNLKNELNQTKAALATAQSKISGAESERSNALDLASAASARLDIQRATAKAFETRLAIAKGDSAAVRTAVSELDKIIQSLTPHIPAENARSLKQVMDLLKNDLTHTDLADTDLVRLISELQLVDESLR